ncbi:hypothetical protein KAZ01_03820 [Candidatus Gracilibacteria bacterium]|nr:hypothetical protein [Candidatus Gracilibacteria bacterium]
MKFSAVKLYDRGLIDGKDYAEILAILPKEQEIKGFSADTKRFLEDGKFQKVTGTDSFIKVGEKTYETITFEKDGTAKESLSSKNSSYTEKLDQNFTIPPDLDRINGNIEDTKSKITKIKEYLSKIDRLKLKSDKTKEEEQILTYESSLKEKQNELEKRYDSLIVLKQDAEEKRKKYVEDKLNIEKQKEIAKNKIEILDKLKLTSVFSQENLDRIINNKGLQEVLFTKIGFKPDFNKDHKEQTELCLKKLITKLLGKDNMNDVFIKDTYEYKINSPAETIRNNFSKDPNKILNNGELKISGIKERLSTKEV